MTERDRAAVDVDLLPSEPELFLDGEVLTCESFVIPNRKVFGQWAPVCKICPMNNPR